MKAGETFFLNFTSPYMYIFLLGTWHTNYFQYMPTKVHLVKAMVFPAIMYECESWSIKKAECQRIDAFEL